MAAPFLFTGSKSVYLGVRKKYFSRWEGRIVEKRYEQLRSAVPLHKLSPLTKLLSGDGVLVVLTEHKLMTVRIPNLIIDYYNEGERIRKHRWFPYAEKYDKTRDTELICPYCGAIFEIENEACSDCAMPAIK